MLTNKKSQGIQLIDSHCHIDFTEFDSDREAVIQATLDAGVSDLVVPAVAAKCWSKTIDICHKFDNCHLSLGLHPMFIDQHQPQHLSELNDLVEHHKPIAIGEIGLDFYAKELNQEKQLCYFDKQLIIAKAKQLPVIIHNRKAHDECLKLLTQNQVKGGIVHAFNGSVQQAFKYIELGFHLGFGGMLTFERSVKLHDLLRAIPLESIVLETDAPDMTVSQHRGARNSPAYLGYVLAAVAQLKKQPEHLVAEQTSMNVRSLFAL